MRIIINRVFTQLYTFAMAVFLGLALVLVLTQFVGLVAVQPSWIEGASQAFLRPSIIAAILTGVFGYLVFNSQPKAVQAKAEEGD